MLSLTGAFLYKAKIRLALGALYTMIKYRHLSMYDWNRALDLDDRSVYDDFRKIVGAESFDHVIEPFAQNVVFYPTTRFSCAGFYSVFSKLVTMRGYSFPRGISNLCEVMAQKLHVENNTQVKSVQRTDGGVVVRAIKDGKDVTYEAEKVVLAIPGNRVLDILLNPLPAEEEFFSSVQYASTVQVLCEGKSDIFKKANVVWTLPGEESSFTSLGNRGHEGSEFDAKYFIAALREKTYKELLETQNLNPEKIKELILKEFPDMEGLKIIRIQVWDSATPVGYPGFVSKVLKFVNRRDWDNKIYFCGDYLENPSTEGALTSSIKLLEQINNY